MESSITGEHRRSPKESQLVLAAQKGDLDAFNELVLIHQDTVFNLAYRILGEADSANDITQNTFITAFNSLPRFRDGSFRNWLLRIATNSCYDELRRRKRHPLVSIEYEDGLEEKIMPVSDWSAAEVTPEQAYEKHELELAVQNALNLLCPDQRAVVVLVDLQAIDYQEATQVLHIPLGTLKSRLTRGRARLRQLMLYHDAYRSPVIQLTDRSRRSLVPG